MVLHSMALHDFAWHGHGMTLHGMVQHCMALHEHRMTLHGALHDFARALQNAHSPSLFDSMRVHLLQYLVRRYANAKSKVVVAVAPLCRFLAP